MAKRKLNLPLIEVIGVSIVIHIVGLLVFGGLTVWKMLEPQEANFEAPPAPQEAIQPQEIRVRLQNSQKMSRQPTRVIQVQNVNQLNLPQLALDMPRINSRVSVAGAGVGTGIGRGFGSGGLDISKSAVNFFGIESSAENVVFVVDVTRSMLEPSRGDVWGFKRVKEEIGEMIDNLSGGTLFNVYAYEVGLEVFSPKPIAATQENKEAAKAWINQYWQTEGSQFVGKKGVKSSNYVPTFTEDMPVSRHRISTRGEGETWDAELIELPPEQYGQGPYASSRMDLPLLAAFENNAEAIFIITDGTPRVSKELDMHAFKDYVRSAKKAQVDRARWMKKNSDSKEMQEFRKAQQEYQRKVAAYQEARRKKGLPPEIHENGRIRGMVPPRSPVPSFGTVANPGRGSLSFDEINDMLRKRARDLYRGRNKDMPPIHIVGYGVEEKDTEGLEELQNGFPGSRYRVLKSDDLKEDEKLKEDENEEITRS